MGVSLGVTHIFAEPGARTSRRDEVNLAQYEVLGLCETQEIESRRDD